MGRPPDSVRLMLPLASVLTVVQLMMSTRAWLAVKPVWLDDSVTLMELELPPLVKIPMIW